MTVLLTVVGALAVLVLLIRQIRLAESVVAATGILVTLPLAGVSLTAGGALLAPGYCSSAWEVTLGWALIAIMPAVVVLFAWCIATVLGLHSRVAVSRP